MAVLELLVRGGGVLERERAGDVRAQAALLDERRDVLAEVVARGAHEDVAGLAVLALARAARRSRPAGRPGAARAKACSCSSPPKRSKAASAPPPCVSARTCSGDVVVVVDGLGAELADEVVAAGRAARDHARAARVRELDRDVADAARPAGDEQVLAAAQAEPLERTGAR